MSRLDELIKQAQAYGAEYSAQLSNHLPMGLLALKRLGASDQRLENAYDLWVERLELKDSGSVEIDSKNWRDHLGLHRFNREYVDYFSRRLTDFGLESVLQDCLGILFEGVGGAAFHPLIRLGYAIENADLGEIAEALASWAMAFLPLGQLGQPGFQSPVQALEAIRHNSLLSSLKLTGPNIFSRMQEASKNTAFSDYSDPLNRPEPECSITELAEASVALYASTPDNFTCLHLVTACHALRIVAPYLQSNSKALRYFWQAASLAYITVGCPEIQPTPVPDNLPDWKQIRQHAIKNNNDHVIKLVYTCWQEFNHYSNPLYKFCAARKVGMA